LLANLLRINQIPLAYVPPEPYQQLRDLVRCRAKLAQDRAEAKIKLRDMLARQNLISPYKTPFGPRGLAWFRSRDFGLVGNMLRDELLARLWHYDRKIAVFDEQLERCRPDFPHTEAITDIYGIGLYSALLIVAELGEVERFRTAKQVGAYAGLTSRVHRSGGHCYQGHVARMEALSMRRGLDFGGKAGCPRGQKWLPTTRHRRKPHALLAHPWPGYSSSGCVPAEPDSASPSTTIIESA
jgi:transposase